MKDALPIRRGVSFWPVSYECLREDCRSRPWKAHISDERLIHQGYLSTDEEAAGAYDAAARERFGEFAALNFPRPGEQGCGSRGQLVSMVANCL